LKITNGVKQWKLWNQNLKWPRCKSKWQKSKQT
jgi:hypothetical protein